MFLIRIFWVFKYGFGFFKIDLYLFFPDFLSSVPGFFTFWARILIYNVKSKVIDSVDISAVRTNLPNIQEAREVAVAGEAGLPAPTAGKPSVRVLNIVDISLAGFYFVSISFLI